MELVESINIHQFHKINDFIVTRKDFVRRMKPKESLQRVVTYYENTNKIKSVYHLNENGLKENMYVEYYENSQLKSRVNYFNDKLNGEFRNYYECGALCDEGFYVNDTNHIYHLTFFHPSYNKRNQIMAYCEYINGNIIGRYSFYDLNGNLYKERYIANNMTLLLEADNPTVKTVVQDKQATRILKEDNKVVLINHYFVMNNKYYIRKHIGYEPIEKKDDPEVRKFEIIFNIYNNNIINNKIQVFTNKQTS